MSKDPLPPRIKDRYRVPDDFGKLDLDIREEPRIPPLVGIFDLPVRCYTINQEWDAHISGAISALAEWRAWVGEDDDRNASVQEVLKFLGQEGDCSVVQLQVRQKPEEPCILEYSANGGFDWIEFADILDCVTQSFLEQSIIDALNTNTTIQNIIDDLTDGGTDNELPPLPTSSEPDELCDATYYMTDKVIDFIEQVLTDASTITLEEFLEAFLTIGGWIADTLKLFWDSIVANSYPDLLTDVQAARDEVAEILYCNELDKEAVITAIDDSTIIGEEAQAAYIGAINAITDGKWALWAFVGSQIDSGEDCSGFCNDWTSTLDFTTSNYGVQFFLDDNSAPYGSWVNGVGLVTATTQQSGTGTQQLRCYIPFDESTLTSNRMVGSYTKGTFNNTVEPAIFIRADDGGNEVAGTRTQSNTTNFPFNSATPFDISQSYTESTADSVRVFARTAFGATNGTAVVTSVTITGAGTKPSQLP